MEFAGASYRAAYPVGWFSAITSAAMMATQIAKLGRAVNTLNVTLAFLGTPGLIAPRELAKSTDG